MANNRPPGPRWLESKIWEEVKQAFYAHLPSGQYDWKFPEFHVAVLAAGKDPRQWQKVLLAQEAYKLLGLYDNPHERAHDHPYR